jgi:hypothetical protein
LLRSGFAASVLFAAGNLASCRFADSGSGIDAPAEDPSIVHDFRIAQYDTAKGIVSLAWRKSTNPNLFTYLIYRDAKGAYPLSTTPIIKSRILDTIFQDTLFRGPGSADSVAKEVEYRIRIQETDEDLGKIDGFLSVTAPPPSMVRTNIRLSIPGSHHDSASINDTLRFAASFSNPTRNVVRLEWSLPGQSKPLRMLELNALSGKDTLAIAFPDPGIRSLTLTAVDDAGTKWSQSMRLFVVQDLPYAFIGEDEIVTYGDSTLLRPVTRDGYGTVIKWEWDVGGKGTYLVRSHGDSLLVHFPDSGVADFPVTLRVTDDDGMTFSHTRHFKVSNTRPIPDIPATLEYPKSVALLGMVYVLDGSTKSMFAFDTSTHSWAQKASRLASRKSFGVAVHNGKIFVVGGSQEPRNNGLPDDAVEIYDPATDSWSAGPSLNMKRNSFTLLSPDNRLEIIGGGEGGANDTQTFTAEMYNDTLKKWELKPNPVGRLDGKVAWIQNRYYDIYGSNYLQISIISQGLEKIAGPLDVREAAIGNPNYTSSAVLYCSVGFDDFLESQETLYGLNYFGCGRSFNTNIFAIDPLTQLGRPLPSTLYSHRGGTACILGKKLYLFGRNENSGISQASEEYLLP